MQIVQRGTGPKERADLVHGSIQVTQGQEGHVVLDGVHHRGHTQLQKLFGTPEHMLPDVHPQLTQAPRFPAKASEQGAPSPWGLTGWVRTTMGNVIAHQLRYLLSQHPQAQNQLDDLSDTNSRGGEIQV